MRIIAGRFRGRVLPGPAGTGVRPATDKVRGAIFNILQNRLDLNGIDVLDLFAGTGSLGFEALSRGAASVTFVEEDRSAAGEIRHNAGLLGCADECEIHREDAVAFLSRRSGVFGLVFADPPYAFGPTADLPGLIIPTGHLHPDGYLIIEHRRGTVFPDLPRGVRSFSRTFGSTELTFFHQDEEESSTDRTIE